MSYFIAWVTLMALLALTFASSYIPMGIGNSVANLAISCLKALVIALFFMHLRQAGALLRIVAVVALLWLALLFGLSSTDYATRGLSPAPWQASGAR
jgi:cytochrome c oxidase subunit 4